MCSFVIANIQLRTCIKKMCYSFVCANVQVYNSHKGNVFVCVCRIFVCILLRLQALSYEPTKFKKKYAFANSHPTTHMEKLLSFVDTNFQVRTQDKVVLVCFLQTFKKGPTKAKYCRLYCIPLIETPRRENGFHVYLQPFVACGHRRNVV